MLQNALVIGGSGGIGNAVVMELLENHYFVFATYFNKQEATLVATDKLTWIHLDVTDVTSVQSVLKQIHESGVQLDTIVYAPTAPVKPRAFFQTQWNEVETHLQVQLKGLHSLVQQNQSVIELGKGLRIIVVLTEYCIGKPPRGLSAYITAKYALMGFAKTLAVELAPYKVTVNMVLPGMTQTELLSDLPPKLLEINAELNPLKRLATPEDVAHTVVFLASEKAAYITGAAFMVNGGATML